jgi:hypothetical protein
MAGIGPIRNSSSIQTTVIRKLFLRSSAGSPIDFTNIPADHRFLEEYIPRYAGDAGSIHCSDGPRFDGVQQI